MRLRGRTRRVDNWRRLRKCCGGVSSLKTHIRSETGGMLRWVDLYCEKLVPEQIHEGMHERSVAMNSKYCSQFVRRIGNNANIGVNLQ